MRLMWETSHPLSFAVAGYALAASIMPNLVLIAAGHLVGSIPAAAASGLGSAAGHRLIAALSITGALYAAALVLGPVQSSLSSVVKWRLVYRTEDRLIAAVSGPAGIAHLEDPKVLDDLALAQGQLTGQMPADAPMTLAMVVSNRVSGLFACLVLASWRWWLGLGMFVMWMAIRRPQLALIREQGALYAGGSEPLRRAWYLQRLASDPAVAKESRVFGLGGWLVERYRSTFLGAMAAPWAVLRRLAGMAGSWPAAGRPSSEVRFSQVRFRYPSSSSEVFAGLDLELRAGRSTALVGINGAGKTTLVKLLARLHDPDSGRILVDGTDLSLVRPAEWQRQVAVVFQDFAHYPLSFAENIGFGAPLFLSDTSGLEDAARRAGALSLLSSLSGLSGWDTVLSRSYEGGVELSGGQWQRVALARALFAVRHGARILVLDEPTAWLDARGEADFFDRFLEITEGTTTLIISHRFSTVRRADHICVLDEGRVLEQGDHGSLIAAGGRYAELFGLQAARFGAPPSSSSGGGP